MPKLRHEAVVEILQNEPELVLQLLACAGMHLRFGTQVAAIIADSNLSDRDADDGGDQIQGLFSDNVFVFEGVRAGSSPVRSPRANAALH